MTKAYVVTRKDGVTDFDETVTTPDTTPVVIYSYTPSANSMAIGFQFQVLASHTSFMAQFVMSSLCKIDDVGTVTEHDTFYVNGPFRDQPTWDVTININSGVIEVLVAGANDSVDWRIVGTVVEHTLGTGVGA